MGGVYLSKPITKVEAEYGEDSNVAYITSSAQGWRTSMEDAHLNILGFNGDPNSALFGVFDGHGGSEVAAYCAQKYPQILTKSLEGVTLTDEDQVRSALIQSYINLDDSLLTPPAINLLTTLHNNNSNNNNNTYKYDETINSNFVGCTAVIALLVSNKLYIANAGDSRCIASCGCGVLRALSQDHKPLNPGELDRIRTSGHSVSEEGRIDGNINISRTIGDHRYKDAELPHHERAISCVPEIRVVDVSGDAVNYVILACDGVWDVMKSQNLINFVTKRLFPEKVSQININNSNINDNKCDKLNYNNDNINDNFNGGGDECDDENDNLIPPLDDSGEFSVSKIYEKGALDEWPGEVGGSLEEILRLVGRQVVQRCIVEKAAGIGCDNVSFQMVLFKGGDLGRLVMECVEGKKELVNADAIGEKVKKRLTEMWNVVAKEVMLNDRKRKMSDDDDIDDNDNDDGNDGNDNDNNDNNDENVKVLPKKKKEKRTLVFKEEKI